MTPERWRQIEEYYHTALTTPTHERAAFLGAIADRDLRQEVESLLAQSSAESPLDTSPADFIPLHLPSGTQIGPYKVDAILGEGGMGTVYRATDTRLGRNVAVKICHKLFTPRFERESRAISALNHPHICTLHDVGKLPSGEGYLVMELVEGESLKERLRAGRLGTEEVLRIGAETAEALTEAHKQGILHCDLKPANIMLSRHGVKVVDFGLARLRDQQEETDVPMGTAAYMAPERMNGQETTASADLFALGLILYEMAVGTLPPPSLKRARIPAKLDPLVSTLLEADPARRPKGAVEVRDELKRLATRGSARRRWLITALAGLVLVVAGAIWWNSRLTDVAPLQVAELSPIALPGSKLDPALSPDGSVFAFSWSREKGDAPGLYLMPTSSGSPTRLTASPTEYISPAWSPDGRQIAFLRNHPGRAAELMLVSTIPQAGPSPTERRLIDAPMVVLFNLDTSPILTWTPDAMAIVLAMEDVHSRKTALFQVDVKSKQLHKLFASDTQDTSPAFSADGKWLAYTGMAASKNFLFVRRMGASWQPLGKPILVMAGPKGPAGVHSSIWEPDGKHLLFARGTQLLEWEFGGKTRVVHVASEILQRVTASWDAGLVPQIIYSTGGTQSATELQVLPLADAGRRATGPPAPLLTFNGSQFRSEFSPDGRWITFGSRASGAGEIWIATSDGKNTRQLTHLNAAVANAPRWSPNGKQIAFFARVPFIAQPYVLSLDSEAHVAPGDAPRKIGHTEVGMCCPWWSGDGKQIYVMGSFSNPVGKAHIFRVTMAGGKIEDLFQGDSPAVSWDGRQIFYGKSGVGPDSSSALLRETSSRIRNVWL